MNNSTITWSSFDLKRFNFSQQEIIAFFIKPIFHYAPSKGRTSDLINGKNSGLSRKILEKLARTTRDAEESGQLYTFQNYPYLKTAERIWNHHFGDTTPQKHQLSQIVDILCTTEYNIFISDDNGNKIFDLSEKLREIYDKKYTFYYRLAVLSIIAATWPLWENCRNGVQLPKEGAANRTGKGKKATNDIIFLRQLVKLIFPFTNNTISTNSSTDSSNLSDDVTILYNDAISLFQKGDYKKSAELFAEIVSTHLNAPYDILSHSYTYLIKCYGVSSIDINPIGTNEELKYWSLHYGSNDIQPRSHAIRQKPSKSKTDTHGMYLFNRLDDSKETHNIVQWITSTKPDGWTKPNDWDFEIINDLDAFAVKLSQTPIRFLLISIDYSQNLEDALLILDTVKTYQNSDKWDAYFCENIEIIIRCPEDYATSLLDTACSFLDNDYPPIKIFLIDEKKRSADYLFAQHPLFYPMTFSFNKPRLESAESALIIVSDNNDLQYVSWLIRDAFWMLPHSSPKMHSRIIVLSPYASEIATELIAECPGLSSFTSIINQTSGEKKSLKNPLKIDIDDISFPKLEFHPISTNIRAFPEKIMALSDENIFPYFVVDSNSDLTAISLGKKIRESLIKEAVIKHQLGHYSSDATVIALRIQNPDFAGLVQDLIVPKETEHANLFFSDYKLITFGSIKDIFSWDQLTGGIIELISQCMHLQYCSQNEHYNFESEPKTEDIWSYYHRLYNRGSSFAAAMSLPYRLFEAGVFPPRWIISNDYDIYWNKASRQLLADNFSKLIEKEHTEDTGLINRLARYEHTRWCCYMISVMGWIPASKDQTVHYINNGVDRHTLQIAKMHPCICSWTDLKLLYSDLHFLYNGAEDVYGKAKINDHYKAFQDDDLETFQKIDLNNIKQTADILRATPRLKTAKINEQDI